MCGIGGWFAWSEQPPQPSVLEEMMNLVEHRGPDGQSWVVCGLDGGHDSAPPNDSAWPVGLGHRRLAIIDLSEGGLQPMTNQEEDLWLVFNGEIYNFVELRRELQGLGRVFRSSSDSEVILQAYRVWGLDMLTRFNGMFALALWDAVNQELVLARDRVGIKPLYLRLSSGGLYFASEMKQFLALPGFSPCLDPQQAHDFLVHGALDHNPGTLLQGIQSLEQGTWLKVSAQGRVQKGRFHSWPEPAGLQPFSPARREQAAQKLADLLQDSVGLRLRADVPVGSCLSGGIDSSGVVCLAARLLREGRDSAVTTGPGQHVFTAAYDDRSIDERNFAAITADRSQAKQHLVFPTAQGLIQDLERLVWHQDGPVETPSTYAQYKVMELVNQEGIRVTLDGQGADELLGGYVGHQTAYLTQLVRGLRLHSLVREAAGIVSLNGFKALQQRSLDTAAILLGRSPRQAGWHAQWLAPELARAGTREALHCRDDLAQRLLLDATRTNLPRLLHYADRNSMAFGVEARLPFLDHRVVDFAFELPPTARIHHGWTKHLLRLALKDTIPDQIVWRRDKIGFAVPFNSWYRDLAGLFRETLAAPSVSPLFNIPDWPAFVDQGLTTERGLNFLWMLTNLEIWVKRFKVSV